MKDKTIPQAAKQLCELGFAVQWLGVKSKAPILKGWTQLPKATLKDLKAGYKAGFNVSVRMGEVCKVGALYVHCIDFDAREGPFDEAKEILETLFGPLGSVTERYPVVITGSGGSSRHIYFTHDQPLASGNIAVSAEKRTDKRNKWEITVIGTGKQVVAPPSVHPNTGAKYEWANSELELDILFNRIKMERGGGWPLQTALSDISIAPMSKTQSDLTQDTFKYFAKTLDINAPTIDSALQILPIETAEDYDQWLLVGMALHHQFGGSAEGLSRWDRWSSAASNYIGMDDLEKRWLGFEDRELRRRGITFASVLKLAGECGWSGPVEDLVVESAVEGFVEESVEVEHGGAATEEALAERCVGTETAAETGAEEETEAGMEGDNTGEATGEAGDEDCSGGLLDQFLDRFVMITEKSQVADLSLPPNLAVHTLEEFKNHYANRRVQRGEQTVSVATAWLTARDRKNVRGVQYSPGEERIYRNGASVDWYNLFYMKEHPSIPKGDIERRVAPFLNHIRYLVPQDDRYVLFMQWLAYLVQVPGGRTKFTPLFIAPHHGTGRGLMVEVINALLGKWNCASTSMGVLAGNKSEFNEYLYGTVFCALHEVKEANKRYAIDDKIRDKLTEPTQAVNVKYGVKGYRDVFTTFFMMSNHQDALTLEKEDRRIWVHGTPDKPKPMVYYDRLYDVWFKGPEGRENLAALFWYLKGYDLGRFKPNQRAPNTPEKELMIFANQSATEAALQKLMDDPEIIAASTTQIKQLIGEELDGETLNVIQLSAILRKKMWKLPGRPKIKGIKSTIWVLKGGHLDIEKAKESARKLEEILIENIFEE